ncbi:hypothetical protein QBC39DRAFT_364056 [Podospora conica]|nr:hypothetical protein QBC39DRAFT_364056 [Schizothecium conicum]
MGPRKRAKRDAAEVGSSATPPTTTTTSPPMPPSPQPSNASERSKQSTLSSQTPSIPINAPRTSSTPTPQGTPRHSLLGQSPSVMDGIATPKSVNQLNQVHKKQSWYGSLPRKSAASIQVARETILGGTVKSKTAVDLSRFSTKKDPDAMSVDIPAASAPELAKPIENGEVVASREEPSAIQGTSPVEETGGGATIPQHDGPKQDSDETLPDAGPPEEAPVGAVTAAEAAQATQPAPGWLGGWFGRPVNAQPAAQGTTEPKLDEPVKPEEPKPAESNLPEPDTVDIKPAEPTKPMEVDQPAPAAIEPPAQPPAPERGSWFGLWSSAPAASFAPAPAPPQGDPIPEAVGTVEAVQPANASEDVVMEDVPPAATEPVPATTPKAGSTWAFWSRDSGATSGKKTVQPEEPGQLAVIGDSSESHPKRANSTDFRDTPANSAPAKEPPLNSTKKDVKKDKGNKEDRKEDQAKALTTPSKESLTKNSKRARPLSLVDDATDSRPSTPKPESSKAESSKAGAPRTPVAAKSSPQNILLPSFSKTYRQKSNPSIIQQITQLLLRTNHGHPKHVFLTTETPKIKKALAIGIHGLYPANYLRPVIGQPTGTSIKFANHSAEAIRRWADSHGCEDCEIEKVALEGEGKIDDRVENLWRLLLNWIDQIRKADLIILGCHSQGVPVGLMLLAKLIDLGIITTAKIGVCAMAGVSLGPFPDYRSSMGRFMGTAAELWEFADPQSEVSQRLEASLKVVLKYGARVTYVGSMDDQLVPLESAIYAPAHHPYIYRSVFIDGRIHAPDFIAHLIGFALKLRNLGVNDHGLVRELSAPLAGSLYSGEGHSRLYDDPQVYDLAVTHALETTDVGNVVCEVHKRQPHDPNPYHLPWIMRGLLEEDFVRTELNSETAELLQQFDEWKPTTKALKDVKYRLEAVRSKL